MEPAVLEVKPEPEDARLAVYRSVTRGMLALLGLIAIAVVFVPGCPVHREDLAKGKTWRASSVYPSCSVEKMTCGAVFFHTALENQPWLEIDLGAPTAFKDVEVINRRDGPKEVADRAVPLILEVSDDQRTWKKIDQIDESFTVWRPKLEATSARYVRARSPRTTYLHLEALNVYR